MAPFQQGLHGQSGGLHGSTLAGSVHAGLLGGPPGLVALFGAGIQQHLHGAVGELTVLSVIGGEVRHHRQRVGVRPLAHVLRHQMVGLLNGWSLVARVFERPGDVSRNPLYVAVVAIGGALINEVGVGLPAPILLLLSNQPRAGALNEPRVYIGDFGHIVEFHESVGGENLVSRRLAEPGEAAAGHFESEQALVAVGDESLGFGVHFRCELARALHVIERQHIGICGRGSLLEAANGHAQN